MNYQLNNISNTRSLKNLSKFEVIKFGSLNVPEDYYMVFSKEIEESIPSLFLQLWKLEGGYDHAFVNIMENDFGLNKQVPVYEVEKYRGRILQITSYRPENSGYSDKEEFFFDIMPKSTSPESNAIHSIPFKCNVDVGNQLYELIIPSWTPIQKIPIKKIKEGSFVELWGAQNIVNLMRVLKL
jgi:hypothetical protein